MRDGREPTVAGADVLEQVAVGVHEPGSLPAAAVSSNHLVARVPRTPAAGSCTGSAPESACATAGAFASPLTSSQTSSAALIAEKPRLMRVDGGFGQERTATTGRSSEAAGDSGKIDAT